MSNDQSVSNPRKDPEKIVSIDSEYLTGKRFDYQEDISVIDDVDLQESTPGGDINWLEDITMLEEDGTPAVFDRYSNSFLKIYYDVPAGREDEIARKVLIKHLQSGNSYGTVLKERYAKFAQPELGPWAGKRQKATSTALGGAAALARRAAERSGNVGCRFD